VVLVPVVVMALVNYSAATLPQQEKKNKSVAVQRVRVNIKGRVWYCPNAVPILQRGVQFGTFTMS
jgi:hypothetical protein